MPFLVSFLTAYNYKGFCKKNQAFFIKLFIFLYLTFYRICNILQIAKKSLSVFGKPNFSDISATKSHIGGKTKFIVCVHSMKTVHYDMHIVMFGGC